MKPTSFKSSICGFGRLGRMLAGVLLALMCAHAVLAQTYVNTQNNSYSFPGPPYLPQIDAVGFDNESIFSVTYDIYNANTVFYSEPWFGTLYYTNNGEMIVNSAGLELDGFTATSYGFEFDDQNVGEANSMAGTFYNPGTIHCDSLIDGNFSPGACLISATNVMIPGTIELGANGTLFITGQNVDLSRSVLTLENPSDLEALLGEFGSAPFTGTGSSGVYTNAWDPFDDLTAFDAFSADCPTAPFFLDLFVSTPYYENFPDPLGAVNRSAFVEDVSGSNVTYNVWFGGVATSLGSGESVIGWAGTYLNYATGQYSTNYLYLNDDYLAGAVTNVPIGPFGYPDNFTLTQSTIPVLSTATAAPVGLPTFPVGEITNNPYVFGEFFGAGITGTNPSTANPSGAVSNLSANIQISASGDLNMNLAQITGAQYVSLTASNQFENNGGALVQSLFSDLNLGSATGSLNVSNVLAPAIPDWNGDIEAWSTRWLAVETNIIITNIVTTTNIITETNVVEVTNDFRTVLVYSDLSPFTTPQVHNLIINATNSVNISDEFNVFGSVFVSAQSMTLTTNLVGVGAGWPEGELNMINTSPPNWSWLGSFPNLLWLTNNGAILMPGATVFIGNVSSNLVTLGAPATSATATLSEGKGANVAKKSTVNIGGTVYTFTNSITKKSPSYVVLIGPNFNASLTNLIAAINHGAGAGKVYSTNKTYANGFVTAGKLNTTNRSFIVAAIDAGPVGNVIPVSVTATNLSWNSPELSGGSNATPGTTNLTAVTIPMGAIINSGVLSDFGSTMSVDNFVNGGLVTNGPGSFILTSLTTTLTNGALYAGGDISLAADNLDTRNLLLQAGRGLILNGSNSISDEHVINVNGWTIDDTNGTGFDGLGLALPELPTSTDPSNNLLGTTITIQSPPPNKSVTNIWAGRDYDYVVSGPFTDKGYFTNNVAIGQLSLTALGPNSQIYFTGTATNGTTNAIYVDNLILNNYASYANGEGTAKIPSLLFNKNIVIYYANAWATTTVNGGPLEEISFQLNHSNTNHLRWVPEYTGLFSSTNIVYPGGVKHSINIGLLDSPLDSDGSGLANSKNPYPLFVADEINFKPTVKKSGMQLTWCSIPSSTNSIYYSTNLFSWTLVTNFVSPSKVPPVGGWPITNVWAEPFHSSHGYYRVRVSPNAADVYGQ